MLRLTLMCVGFLLVNAKPGFQDVNNSISISSFAKTEKETAILQCDSSVIKANLELIKSDTNEVFQKVGGDVTQLLKDFLVCIDPITIGFCIGYVYPSVVLGMLADIPISLVKYLHNIIPLLAEVVREIISCSQ